MTTNRSWRSFTADALPIFNEFLRRMRLEDFLRAALPPEDRRTNLSPVKAVVVLLRNMGLTIYVNNTSPSSKRDRIGRGVSGSVALS